MAFVLQPAVDVAPFQTEIDKAVEASVAFLDLATACDHLASQEALDRFCQGYQSLAPRLGIAGATNPAYALQAWWFNLSVVGFVKTGITAPTIQQVLAKFGELNPEDVANLPSMVRLSGRGAVQNTLVLRTMENVVRQFWCFVSDVTPEGVRFKDAHARVAAAVDYSLGVNLDLASLHRDYPLPSMEFADEVEGVGAWRSRIYWLALSLLGHKPAN